MEKKKDINKAANLLSNAYKDGNPDEVSDAYKNLAKVNARTGNSEAAEKMFTNVNPDRIPFQRGIDS